MAVKLKQSYKTLESQVKTRTSELNQKIEELARLNTKLEEAMTKDEFLSMAAHQLRTPLGTIRWNIELLLHGRKGVLSSEAQETLKDMQESNLRLVALVNDLLDVSKMSQKYVDNAEPINVGGIIEDVVNDLKHEAEQKHILITVQKSPDDIPQMILDSKLFRQILQNIIVNAIVYNAPKGTVTIAFEKKLHSLIISIADTGIGIPQKDQKKIFEKFYRASNAVTSEYLGTGFGLFMVKSYIERWGGHVWFESIESEGSTFYMELPFYHNSIS